MSWHLLLEPLQALHRSMRSGILRACREQEARLADVAEDGDGDTLYAVDKVSEALLVGELSGHAASVGGIVLVGEGIAGGSISLPAGLAEASCRFRVIVDPIDGTRGLMYQKRPAWILTGVAQNHGAATRLSDIELALQTEIPLLKQHLSDELWAVRGQGTQALRANVLTGESEPLRLRPSQAAGIEHGFAMVSRFFPGARDVLAAIDDELIEALLGPPVAGKARCFEDQYTATGGQLYELMVGHDRFVCDLRPLLQQVLRERGLPRPLCVHPYDLCTLLIAEELGVLVRHPSGEVLDAPLDVDSDLAWAGYANADLHRRIEPLLRQVLQRRGLLS